MKVTVFFINLNFTKMKQQRMLKMLKTSRRSLMYSLLRTGFVIIGLFICSMVYSQTSGDKIKITGKITGNDGDELIGASISEKGTTNGTASDVDGSYSLTVGANSTLIISYVGYISQEVAVGGKSTIDVILSSDSKILDEVVVTALGIKREKKALGYAVQDVKGEGLNQTRDANVANALAGKMAGVQIKANGTGVGGSTRIVIRGNNSITGNNQPLIVVDGIPIDNFSSKTDDYWGNSYVDKGSGLGDISPDDVENISVLKGPAAAALYGSRAGNGVLLITTKGGLGGAKAAQKGVGITFNTNFTFENPMQVPKFQNEYGQGSNGQFDKNSVGSWGPKMDGSVKEMALGSFAYSARDNDLYKDFLKTGTTWTNSLELKKASEDMSFLAGVTRMDNQGVIPNSGLDRTSINLRGTAKLAKWLSADVKINYINQNTKNRIAVALDPNNVFYDNLYRPRSVAFSDYDAYKATNWARPDGKPAAYLVDHNSAPDNVFWSVYRNQNSDKRDRYIGMAAFDIKFTNWLSLKLRSGMDNYTFLYDWTRATGNPYWEQGGSYRVQTERFKETNTDFLFTATGNWGDFGIVGTAGGNTMKRATSLSNDWSGELYFPDFYSIYNGKEHKAIFDQTEKQVNSLYATASLSYASMLYLDLTARNDWSSTLPVKNNSYFYPSIGGSWVFSQMLENAGTHLGPLSFGKLRVSWAEVGNDTDAYQLMNYMTLNYNIKEGKMEATRASAMANPDLKPESIRSWELGLELRGFNNRAGLDLSYYKKNAFDQILKIDVPAATGYKYQLINAGNIQNQGFEIALNATPLQSKNLKWETLVNWSTNKNKIIALSADSKRQLLSDGTGLPFKIVAEEGGSYGDIWGTAYARDDKGNIIIGDNGIPVQASDEKLLGNSQPKGLLGWSNTFSYKDFSFNFLFDLTYGGKIWMGSIDRGNRFGNLESTLANRDGGLIVPGVTKDGQPNTKAIKAQEYWVGISGITEAYMYDATNARLRELSLGYTLPKSVLKNTPFASIKASLVARNLFMIYSKTKGFDPEAGFSNANSVQGVEIASMPTMRSIGFNINVAF
jgi:TonB-linked SusC/RagA family outer membrane protein